MFCKTRKEATKRLWHPSRWAEVPVARTKQMPLTKGTRWWSSTHRLLESDLLLAKDASVLLHTRGSRVERPINSMHDYTCASHMSVSCFINVALKMRSVIVIIRPCIRHHWSRSPDATRIDSDLPDNHTARFHLVVSQRVVRITYFLSDRSSCGTDDNAVHRRWEGEVEGRAWGMMIT